MLACLALPGKPVNSAGHHHRKPRKSRFLLLFFIEALSRLSQRRWELLQEPRVAIGITKPGKLHLTKIDHLVHLDTTLYESLASLVDVVYHQVQAMNRSRLHI